MIHRKTGPSVDITYTISDIPDVRIVPYCQVCRGVRHLSVVGPDWVITLYDPIY